MHSHRSQAGDKLADRLSVGTEASTNSSRYSSLANSRVGSLEQARTPAPLCAHQVPWAVEPSWGRGCPDR